MTRLLIVSLGMWRKSLLSLTGAFLLALLRRRFAALLFRCLGPMGYDTRHGERLLGRSPRRSTTQWKVS